MKKAAHILERRAGLICSLVFHAALFLLLLNKSLAPAPSPSPENHRIFIQLQKAAKTTTNQSPENVAPPPSPENEPVKESFPEELPEEADARDQALEKRPDRVPPPSPEAQRPYVEEIKKIRARQKNKRRQVADSLSSLRRKIQARAPAAEGVKDDFISFGADEGVVRTLDVSGVSESAAQLVLNRYDIRVTRRFVSGKNKLQFLNRARTKNRTFYNQPGSGFFEVFELSRRSMKKLIQLEENEIARRGLDPDETRVLKVTFGIVRNNDGWDLGIVEFEYEEL